MLHVFYGNNVVGVREKAQEFLNTQTGNVKWITPESHTEGIFKDLAGGTSLFGGEEVYVIDTPSEKKDMFDDTFLNIELLAESANMFVLIEDKLLAPQKKILTKHTKHLTELSEKAAVRFNTFALADAFSTRNKKSFWILLSKAREEGISSEEIIGTLYWQVKVLRLAESTSSAAEAGQKPFVYDKAKRACATFEPGELTQISEKLLSIYHDSHLGLCDSDVALEQFVLGVYK